MAPRRSAVAETVEEEFQLVGLKFNEPLSWRAGKAIPTSELLRRLETLSAELREMDQEQSDKDSLTKVAHELAGQNLISHKDRGVRAFTACCLVDVLKICAPDAPFTAIHLRDIFHLFVTSILPALSDPSNPYNVQHVYVLASLAEVKSIILLTDIPQHEGLLLQLFTSFFDIISGSSKNSTGEQISKNVEYNVNSILIVLVDESQNLPAEVIDIILAQFLRAASAGGIKGRQGGNVTDEKQSTLLAMELPPAYRTAELICNTCSEKMARYVSQYFNDVILESSAMAGKSTKLPDHRRSSITVDSDDDGLAGPTEADLRELNKAHRLLRELWRASPPVLQNVIPQLEAELSAENIQLRLLATETLGDIISGIGAAGPPPPPVIDPTAYPPLTLSDYFDTPTSNSILITPMSPQSFAQAHPSIYHSFTGRRNDKSAVIRAGWTTAIGRILTTSAGGTGLSREDEAQLVNCLAEKLNDADERVRIAAVKAVGSFSFKETVSKLSVSGGVTKSGSVLCSLADRARDRKHAVRVEAMTTISKIWGVAAGQVLAGNENVISVLGAIPSKIFDSYYTNDLDVNVLLDHVMFEQLIPLSYPQMKKNSKQSNGNSQGTNQPNGDEAFDADRIRTERILAMIKSLEPKSKKAFFVLQGRQTVFRDVLTSFLKQCEEYNGGVMDQNAKEIKDRLSVLIQWLVMRLPDSPRATADLWKFAKLHDRRAYQLIRFAIALESDFKTVFKAIREFSKRIEAAPGAPSGLLETMIPLIYRGSSLIYNRSHLPAIIEYSRSDVHGLGATAHEVLNEISQRNPHIFKAQVNELCKLLQDQAPTETRANDQGSVETLKACAAFSRKYPEEVPHDRRFIQALVSFAQYGEPPKAAKYAVSILMAAAERKEMHAKDLLQKSTKDWSYGCNHFLTKLATISQLRLLEPDAFDEAVDNNILDIAMKQILLQVRTEARSNDRSWQDESVLDDECQAKCLALKLLANQLRATKEPDIARSFAEPIFKLLRTLVAQEGEISKAAATPVHHKSRLRLVAAKLILKLCINRIFDELLRPMDFNNLAIVAQDANYHVRRGFIEKLQKYLVQNRLPSRFYTIIFLVNFEPEISFRQNTLTWIRSRAKVLEDQDSHIMEATLTRLLSLLAHHPDYSPDPNDLIDTAQYILFYLNSVANENNLGLIYRYAERVKQARDAIKPEQSDNLYVLSDLTQATILRWQEKKGWNMQSFPGKLRLSKDLFAPMPNHDAAQEVAAKQYLPEEMDSLLSGLLKANYKRQKRKSDDDELEKPAVKKQKSATKPASKSPSTKKDKVAKPKTSARQPKRSRAHSESTPSNKISNVERRRSSRGAGAISYADRDSDEDEEEMMAGVAKWEYSDGHIESDDENVDMDSENPAEDVGGQAGFGNEAEPEAKDSVEPESDHGSNSGQSSELAPSRTNGRTPISKKVVAKPKAQAKKKPKPAAKGKAGPRPKPKSKGRPSTTNKKGKAVTKDLYDVEDSD